MTKITIKTIQINALLIKIPFYEKALLHEKNLPLYTAMNNSTEDCFNVLFCTGNNQSFNGEFSDLKALKDPEIIYIDLIKKGLLSFLICDENFINSTSNCFLCKKKKMSYRNFTMYYEDHLKDNNYLVGNFDTNIISIY